MTYNLHPKVRGRLLDAYLAIGWYRLGHLLFTTEYLDSRNPQVEVHWLRYPLSEFTFTKKHKELIRKCKNFEIAVAPFINTTEIDELYSRYYAHIDFEASPHLNFYLSLDETAYETSDQVYESLCVTIRDQGKLIAVGILDNGDESVAGIINFYDPEYSKYSLGRMLILAKVHYALSKGKTYYYPGYIAKDYSKFDYKLFLGKDIAEIWDVETEQWLEYERSKLLE